MKRRLGTIKKGSAEEMRPLILEININGLVGYDFEIGIRTVSVSNFDYEVNWDYENGDNWESFGNVNATHTYPSQNKIYQVAVRGDFPSIYMRDIPSRNKLKKILQWGDIKWELLYYAFGEINNLHIAATDSPNLMYCESLQNMFLNSTGLTGLINHWDLGIVTNMRGMFQSTGYNENLAGLDVGNVLSMVSMFWGEDGINQNFNTWNFNINVDLTYFIRGTDMSIPNVNLFLEHLANIMVGSGRTANKRVGVYNCQRTGSSDSAYNALVNDGWAVNGITRI